MSRAEAYAGTLSDLRREIKVAIAQLEAIDQDLALEQMKALGLAVQVGARAEVTYPVEPAEVLVVPSDGDPDLVPSSPPPPPRNGSAGGRGSSRRRRVAPWKSGRFDTPAQLSSRPEI